MSGWLLDTNVLSEIRRKKPHRKVVAFVGGQPLDLLYVSTVTLAEIRFGIELVTDANRRAELNAWLTHKVRTLFAQRVQDVVRLQRYGRPVRRDCFPHAAWKRSQRIMRGPEIAHLRGGLGSAPRRRSACRRPMAARVSSGN